MSSLHAIDAYDWAGDERWMQYELNLHIPDGLDRQTILLRKKIQFYQRNVVD